MNSRGLSVAMRSEAHGSKTIPVPTLKGLNHVNVGYRLGSTPSGSDLSADYSLGWRLPAPPGAIDIGPLRGPKIKAKHPVCPATDLWVTITFFGGAMVSKEYSLTYEVFKASCLIRRGEGTDVARAGRSRPRFPSFNRKSSSN